MNIVKTLLSKRNLIRVSTVRTVQRKRGTTENSSEKGCSNESLFAVTMVCDGCNRNIECSEPRGQHFTTNIYRGDGVSLAIYEGLGTYGYFGGP